VTVAPAPAPVPEKRHSMADLLKRIGALDYAGLLIGKAVLAEKMGIPERTLRSYTGVSRRLPAHVLTAAATALEAHCAEITAQAAKLRALADEGGE
jgi:hypothetical protein